MPALSRKLLFAGMAALLVALFAGLIVLALPMMPFQYQRARQRWEQQRMRHYEVEVSWANGWDYGNARVELRDGQIVRALDLDTGQPLVASKRSSAGYFGSIDNLFEIIQTYVQPQLNWRNLLAHYVPALTSQLVSCAAPLPRVRYDPQFGFPADIWYNDSWCANTFFNYSNVKITRFSPLP